ncbi:MAG: hypothetical protein WCJ93_05590 [Methanomicrobiales archaeon]
MKITLTILIVIILAVLACGCTAITPPTTQSATLPQVSHTTAIPNITGTWSGPMQGYDQNTGFSDYHNQTMTMIVTGQQGRIFSGHYIWVSNGTAVTEGFAGVIGAEGTTLSTAEQDEGYSSGIILSGNEIELTWHHAGAQYGVAIDSLTRV